MWLRRLYTSADGRDLVAMDSRRRVFTGLLRRLLVLRDEVCSTPWCQAPIAHVDHTTQVRQGGPTSYANGRGTCVRCNHVKEAPGWHAAVTGRGGPRTLTLTTPTGLRATSVAPPLLGWGTRTTTTSSAGPAATRTGPGARAGARPPDPDAATPRPRRRPARHHTPPDRRPARRPRSASRLERQLCRYLT